MDATAEQQRAEQIGHAETIEAEPEPSRLATGDSSGSVPPLWPPDERSPRRRWREQQPQFPWMALLALGYAAWMLFWAYERLRSAFERERQWRLEEP